MKSLFFLIAAAVLYAQQTPAPTATPGPAKPSPTKKQAAGREDFLKAQRELQKNLDDTERFARAAGMPDIITSINGGRLPGDQPEVPLPMNALRAINLSRSWQEDSAEPVMGQDGRIIYVYGQGMPNLPCKPDHFTSIEFQPGERLNTEDPYSVSSTEAWKIDTNVIINDGQVQSYVTVYARRVGADSELIVYTDRRRYSFRLLSTTKGYVSRVAFQYPGWEQQKKLKEFDQARLKEETDQAAQLAAEKARQDKLVLLAEGNTLKPPTPAQYEWTVPKDAEYMRPASVTDDGQHVKVLLTKDVIGREWPILYITGKTGRDTPNIHINRDDLSYTVDGLFKKADLAVGPIGRKQTRVEIRRVAR